MQQRAIISLVGFTLAVCVTTAHAHHSIAGAYDRNRRVTIEGVVKNVEFVNPHPFVVVAVTDGRQAQDWMLEMDNRWELVEAGFTDATLRPGDRVVVTGIQARLQKLGLYIYRLDRSADGFFYQQVGSRPSIGRVDSSTRK
jgi:hypothetical protein